MDATALDHVGVVTDQAEPARESLRRLGFALVDEGEADAYGVACQFWSPDGRSGPTVELVTPTRAGSAVQGQLSRHGPGIHHVAVEVADVVTALAELRRGGAVPIDDVPRAGARPGMRVAFVYLGRATGMIVELVDYRGEPGGPR